MDNLNNKTTGKDNNSSLQDYSPDGLKNSKIVNIGEVELIKKWIDLANFNKVSFKLLYRATEHGKSAFEFHSRCDNKVRYIINTNKYYYLSYREVLLRSLVLTKVEDSEASLIFFGSHIQMVPTKKMILRPSSSLWTTGQNLLVMFRAELYIAGVIME